jgi:hypothetical protein
MKTSNIERLAFLNAAKHGHRPFGVLSEPTSGNVWIPAIT